LISLFGRSFFGGVVGVFFFGAVSFFLGAVFFGVASFGVYFGVSFGVSFTVSFGVSFGISLLFAREEGII